MRLADLDARLLKVTDASHFREVEHLSEADGVEFLCPKCFETNGGKIGTHAVICWRPRVPQDVHPVPGRWELVGTSLADLTLVAGSSSVLLQGGCNAHFFVENGEIRFA